MSSLMMNLKKIVSAEEVKVQCDGVGVLALTIRR